MACGFIGLLEDDYTWVRPPPPRRRPVPTRIRFPALLLASPRLASRELGSPNDGICPAPLKVTQQLVKVANKCCDGRIVSMLEGGYMTDGGPSSAFARSVAAHVGALTEGCVSLETWDENDAIWESAHENHLSRERERRRQLKAEKEAARIKKEFAELDGAAGEILKEEYGNAGAAGVSAGGESKAEEGQAAAAAAPAEPVAGAGGDDSEQPSPRKRSRRGGGSVDYVALAAKLDQEGKGSE